jgi:hypothetical protein
MLRFSAIFGWLWRLRLPQQETFPAKTSAL